MAKRFKMLAPFDSVSGNVSGAQKLAYPVNGQGAYDAPAGKNYAQNYKPRFIMNERKSDGRLYFQVKQRSATTITARSKRAMAVLGGSGAIIGAILKDKTSALYQALYEAWLVTKPFSTKTGEPCSFRQWLSAFIMGSLRAKSAVISVLWNNEGDPDFITINNPFVSGGDGTYDVTIGNEVLVKFWGELAINPIEFTVNGQKGIAVAGDSFLELVESNYNVLGLTCASSSAKVKQGNLWLFDESDKPDYPIGDSAVASGMEYTLTDVAPE